MQPRSLLTLAGMMPRSLPTLAAATLAAACGGDPGGRSAAQIQDSAGVRVVVNAAPDPASLPTLRLSAEPLVHIGVADGAPEYLLFRANRALLLSDGTLVVANAGTLELRYYDASGRHLRSAGGRGQGPGEFMGLTTPGVLPGDSVLAFDTQLRRFSVWTPTGEFARSYSPPMEVGVFPSSGDALADGRTLLRFNDARGPQGITQTTVSREPVPLFLVSPDGSAREFGTVPTTEMLIYVDGPPSALAVIFGRNTYFHAGGDRIAIGDNDAFSVRIYDGDGALLHLVRLERDLTPVAPGDFERALPPPVGIAARIANMAPHMPRHATFPEFDMLRVGRDSHLWVRDYRPIWEEGPMVWHRFDAEGVLVARIELPANMDLLEASADRVVVRVRDDLDIEGIRVYRLE